MSTNDVVLFGVLAADAEIRSSGPAGTRWALLKVETYQFVRDPQTKKPTVQAILHEVHCFDELSVDPLASLGKKGFWIRIRGNLSYGENRQAIVRVPVRGGQATVSAYFGNKIRPDVPFHMLVAEMESELGDRSGVDALHGQAALRTPPDASVSSPVTPAKASSAVRPTSRPIAPQSPPSVPRKPSLSGILGRTVARPPAPRAVEVPF
ncbi:hypothetical protein ACVIGB_000016 [Bradyrhizobium sp. USDA 4341]